ncbi:glycosyltransferase family A protein [Polynucleobacter nymphae]|uniref:glycosyltransferase family A protein n=1 Tax=Polynucleobacter nymphae TaxID=2081043 RepID=UPI001C0E1BDD|nr:glycosyltransferase family A protein [Polynucleobacter nymphae]MBU3607871.1 glycosyltransferase family 2 protein [Polynucleobacter nymphae]
MLFSNFYQKARSLHRRLRNGIKETFRPEISQRKIRTFIKNTQIVDKSEPPSSERSSIAVIVPCYGHAPFLQEMFESIQRQTIPPNEVIFVVDRSPDNTLPILEGLVQENQSNSSSRFTILENESNLGQAASLNKGVEYSSSDLIMILNDDDYLMHDSIEVTHKILKKYPQAVLLGGHSLHFGGNSLGSTPKLIQSICPVENIEIDLRLPNQVKRYRKYNDINMTHSGSSFYKFAWKTIGGYYPDKSKRLVHFSDRDFQLRMNALFPVALSNITPLSCWRNDSSVDQGVNS